MAYDSLSSLHDILQGDVIADPKAAQRDDWASSTAKATKDAAAILQNMSNQRNGGNDWRCRRLT